MNHKTYGFGYGWDYEGGEITHLFNDRERAIQHAKNSDRGDHRFVELFIDGVKGTLPIYHVDRWGEVDERPDAHINVPHTLVHTASIFAKHKHGEQNRKYTNEPYWHHLERVANRVAEWTNDPEIIAAAWLHDVLEDTNATRVQLVNGFGERVARIVEELTDYFTPEDFPKLSRAVRKRFEAQRLSEVSAEAKMIKRADIEDNTRDIEANDPKFAVTYLKEKDYLLECLA